MKKVLILAHFCNDFDTKGNNRFNYLANMLSQFCEVELLTTDFSHRKKAYRDKNIPNLSYKVTMLHEKPYKKNISLGRLRAHSVFGKSVKKYLLSLSQKPDVIYCAVPSPDAACAAAQYANKNKIKFIIDVQDLWPEAFLLALNIPPLFYPMKRKADKIYSLADEIVAVSQQYCDRAKKVNTKVKTTYPVFIGTNLSQFDKNVLENEAKRDAHNFTIAYAGSLSKSYDIRCAIDATAILNEQGYKNIKLLVMGDGPFRESFMQYAKDKKINAVFTGHLPYPQMCAELSKCDASLNLIVGGAAQSIINKHADYSASGIPVINSQECSEYRELVENYEMGFNCENENPQDMAQKIKMLIDDPQLKIRMGQNARRCAEEKFDRQLTYKQILNLILED